MTVTNPAHFGVGLGNTNLRIEFTNHAATACVLNGYPTVAGVSATGTVTVLRTPHGSYFGDPGPPANIAPGQIAAVNISGGDACIAAQRGQHRIYLTLRIGLPGGGFVTASSAHFDTSCGVSVSKFGVPADQQPPLNPPQSPLTATIHAPQTVHPGQDLRYTVTLTNTSDTAYSLRPCPAYQESFYAIASRAVKGVTRNYYLNCEAVGQIDAHASVTFRMQLQLPATLPATKITKFNWQLQGDSGPVTNAPLQIVR